MKTNDWLQLIAYFGVLIAAGVPLGRWMARIFSRTTPGRVESLIYRAAGAHPGTEMTWGRYATAMLFFNIAGFAVVLGLQLVQASLPANPQQLANVPFPLALNTAVSFMTNTNWQAYSGESTLSYLVQMLGLAVQNFLSAATGIAVLLALVRGLTRKQTPTVGNFWTDVTRVTVHVLLPLSIVFALLLVWQGVPQTFAPYADVTTLDGASQTIPLGPAASQIAIKQLGTNGGGFFGVNSAHPFENPTPFSNFLQVLTIILLPAALCFTFGEQVKDRRQGCTLFAAMLAMLLISFSVAWWAELQPHAATGAAAMEGKETRFGIMNSVLWSTTTTAASNGSVNAMHDSLSPIAGGLALLNMLLGEVVFGGVGAGLYGMLLFVLLTVFLAGLMVGRSPEYLGKRIEAREVRWAVVAILAPCVLILIGAASACLVPQDWFSMGNSGPHGLTEILYAFASASANNGSAFGGLSVNNDFFNYALSVAMFFGRFAVIIPVLAIAGSLAAKKTTPPSPGTFPTHGATFAVLLIAVILIVGALTFFPALTLGPVVEHLLMLQGRTF